VVVRDEKGEEQLLYSALEKGKPSKEAISILAKQIAEL
jgi:aminoglycoside phosphotransferase family enzyme